MISRDVFNDDDLKKGLDGFLGSEVITKTSQHLIEIDNGQYTGTIKCIAQVVSGRAKHSLDALKSAHDGILVRRFTEPLGLQVDEGILDEKGLKGIAQLLIAHKSEFEEVTGLAKSIGENPSTGADQVKKYMEKDGGAASFTVPLALRAIQDACWTLNEILSLAETVVGDLIESVPLTLNIDAGVAAGGYASIGVALLKVAGLAAAMFKCLLGIIRFLIAAISRVAESLDATLSHLLNAAVYLQKPSSA